MDVFGPKAAKYDADMRPTHAVSTKVMTGSHKTAASAGTANFTICLNVSAGKSISFSFLLLWTTSDDAPVFVLGDFCPEESPPIILGLFCSLVDECVISMLLFVGSGTGQLSTHLLVRSKIYSSQDMQRETFPHLFVENGMEEPSPLHSL